MAVRAIESPRSLDELVGTELGVGDWVTIDQQLIDNFAGTTRDDQWLHVDPARAAEGPFGTTIAHGYLTLSLLPWLTASCYRVDGVRARVNYGLERVRFPSVVPVGSRLRNRAALISVESVEHGVKAVVRNTVEREGTDRPACIADTVTLFTT